MSKRIALFTGAGFSYEFGMPLVFELTAELKSWLTLEKFERFNRRWTTDGNGYSPTVEKIFLDLLNSAAHYEAILGGLEVEADRHENASLRQEYHALRGWLLDVVFLLLHQRIVLNDGHIKGAIKFHRGMKYLMKSQSPLWIFSLNHDLILEMLASSFGYELKNGFGNEETNLAFDKKRETTAHFKIWKMNDPAQAAGSFFTHGQAGVNLLKIHGSLDIFGFKDFDEYLCIQPEQKTVDGFISVLNKLDKLHDLPKVNEEIVVLDSAGTEQFLRKSILSGAFKFRRGSPGKVPKMTLDLFRSNLNYAEELVICGYGFGDEHINRIIRDWLEFTSKRSIRIVDPFRSSTPSGFEHLSRQVEIKRTTALDYFASLPGGELSETEKLLLKLKRFSKTERGKRIMQWAKPLIDKYLKDKKYR